jgi:16S rRNA (guanine(527)-N(7))-methyltransferase RsmG
VDASAAELRSLLERGLYALGVPAEREAVDRWIELAVLLDRWNQRMNLTAHRGAPAIAQRLLLEAAALSAALPPAASIADLGSGAGIPGLPIALCRPGTVVRLIESRERRHHFQRAAIRALGLENAIALLGRAETLAPAPCDGVVAQAIAQPDRAISWMRAWMADSGWIALATIPDAVPRHDPELMEGRLVSYAAPGGPERAVWIARLRKPGSQS